MKKERIQKQIDFKERCERARLMAESEKNVRLYVDTLSKSSIKEDESPVLSNPYMEEF